MNSERTAEDKEHADELWAEGVQELMSGRIQSSIDCFNRSLECYPTAEGHTYRGWALSFLGMFEQAVEECQKAILIDPDFGNPYNDIGVYLMQLRLLDDAIPWLEKAKKAPRYASRHFPFLNLGHIYVAQGETNKALAEYVQALDLDPENPVALKAIDSLDLKFD
ncbi:MAG: tetratricopeptide repeat protein [Terriglobia bacterium]